MRISDIFKKNSGQPQKENKPPAENPPERIVSPIPAVKKDKEQPAPDTRTYPKDRPQLPPPEQIYTECIVEIKNILSDMEKGRTYAGNITCIPRLVMLMTNMSDGIMLLSDRATPDVYLYGHSVNVTILSIMLAQALKIETNKRIVLAYCAFLHDIGMIKSMDMALKNGKLTPSEYSGVKRHVASGQRMAQNFSGIDDDLKTVISKVTGQIHERVDGSGYPGGLKGDEIHEFARIIAIADVFEALSHPRPYRNRLIPHEAVKSVITAADTGFDAQMVKMFVENISLYPAGSYVRLNSDEIARVTGTKKGLPTRPTVQIIIDPSGEKAHPLKITDLSASPMIFVKEAVDETKLALADKKLALELKAMRWWVKGL